MVTLALLAFVWFRTNVCQWKLHSPCSLFSLNYVPTHIIIHDNGEMAWCLGKCPYIKKKCFLRQNVYLYMTVCTLWGNRCLHPVKIYYIDLIPYHCTRRKKKGHPNPNQILFEAATGVKYLKSIRGRKKYYRRGGGGSSMISACILINMTSSLARQIIPPGLGVQLTMLAALRLEPASFSSHTKKRCQGFLIEINFIPWKSLKSLAPTLPPMGRPPLPRSISLTRVGLVLDGDVRMEAWNQVCGVTVMQQRTERRQWILGIWVCVCVFAASTALSPHLFMWYVWVATGSDGPTTRGSHAADLSRPERLLLPCEQRRAERSMPGCRLPIRATRVRVNLQLCPTKCRLENFCLRLYF